MVDVVRVGFCGGGVGESCETKRTQSRHEVGQRRVGELGGGREEEVESPLQQLHVVLVRQFRQKIFGLQVGVVLGSVGGGVRRFFAVISGVLGVDELDRPKVDAQHVVQSHQCAQQQHPDRAEVVAEAVCDVEQRLQNLTYNQHRHQHKTKTEYTNIRPRLNTQVCEDCGVRARVCWLWLCVGYVLLCVCLCGMDLDMFFSEEVFGWELFEVLKVLRQR